MKKLVKNITDKFKRTVTVDPTAVERIKRIQEAAKEAAKKARSEKG